MDVIRLLLYTAAAVCLLLAVFDATRKVNLLALGLLAWVAVPLLDAVQAVD